MKKKAILVSAPDFEVAQTHGLMNSGWPPPMNLVMDPPATYTLRTVAAMMTSRCRLQSTTCTALKCFHVCRFRGPDADRHATSTSVLLRWNHTATVDIHANVGAASSCNLSTPPSSAFK